MKRNLQNVKGFMKRDKVLDYLPFGENERRRTDVSGHIPSDGKGVRVWGTRNVNETNHLHTGSDDLSDAVRR